MQKEEELVWGWLHQKLSPLSLLSCSCYQKGFFYHLVQIDTTNIVPWHCTFFFYNVQYSFCTLLTKINFKIYLRNEQPCAPPPSTLSDESTSPLKPVIGLWVHLVVPSQRGTKSLSRRFSFTVPCWRNDLTNPEHPNALCKYSRNSCKLICSGLKYSRHAMFWVTHYKQVQFLAAKGGLADILGVFFFFFYSR